MSDCRFKTLRLILRPFVMEDAEQYFQITRDPEIQHYVPYACANSLKETQKNIKICYSLGHHDNDFYLVFEEKASKNIVGALIATENIRGQIDVTYFIAAPYRKKGYMSEALQAFIQAMPTGKTLRFDIKHTNIPSIRTVSKFVDINTCTSVSDDYIFLFET